MSNKSLMLAKKKRDDEFYTRSCDVNLILDSLQSCGKLKGKIIFLPCDSIDNSEFFLQLKRRFFELGVIKVYAICKDEIVYHVLDSTGVHDIPTCTGKGYSILDDTFFYLLKRSDLVLTNPPWSLCIRFTKELIISCKDFALILPLHIFSNSEIGNAAAQHKLFRGYNVNNFITPDGTYKKTNGCLVSTFIELRKPKKEKDFCVCDDGLIRYNKLSSVDKSSKNAFYVPITILGTEEQDEYQIIKSRSCPTKKGKIFFASVLVKNIC